MSNDYKSFDDENALAELRTEMRRSEENSLTIMLSALAEALDADMEQGAPWMNDAAHAEFSRKYPRFTTLFRVARHVVWEEVDDA